MAQELPLIPAIQWYEGMLLSPQHFQQQERRWDQLLACHLSHLSTDHWGVINLLLDPVTLPTGLYRILQLKAIMPDGLILDYQATPHTPSLEIDLTSYKEDLRYGHTTIHVCVPSYVKGSSPVIGQWPRYDSIEGEEVSDENTQDNVIQIPRLRPRISLIAGSYPPAQYQSFPLARIGVQDEAFVLKPFMPPCFHVHPSSILGQQTGALVKRLREKAAYLSEKWQSLIGTPLLAESSAQLRPLVQSLPFMETLIQQGKTHPCDFHKNLCHMAGILSTLRLGQIPPLFPPYNHNDIMGSATPLLEWCNLILESLEKAYSLLLFTRRNHIFSVMLQPEIFTKKILIGLKAPPSMSEKELEEWMRDSIIVSESMMESVQMRRITGAPRHLLSQSDLYDLMPGRGVLIFMVETDPTFLKPGEKLLLANLADTEDKRPTEVVLYLKHSELGSENALYLDAPEEG